MSQRSQLFQLQKASKLDEFIPQIHRVHRLQGRYKTEVTVFGRPLSLLKTTQTLQSASTRLWEKSGLKLELHSVKEITPHLNTNLEF